MRRAESWGCSAWWRLRRSHPCPSIVAGAGLRDSLQLPYDSRGCDSAPGSRGSPAGPSLQAAELHLLDQHSQLHTAQRGCIPNSDRAWLSHRVQAACQRGMGTHEDTSPVVPRGFSVPVWETKRGPAPIPSPNTSGATCTAVTEGPPVLLGPAGWDAGSKGHSEVGVGLCCQVAAIGQEVIASWCTGEV